MFSLSLNSNLNTAKQVIYANISKKTGLGRWLSQYCLPHKHKDLSSILHPPKKPGAVMDACNPSHSKMEGRDALIPRTHWPASLAYLAKRRPLRSPVQNKRRRHPRNDIQGVLWPPRVHSYGVCSQAHSIHTEGRGQSEEKIIKMLYSQNHAFIQTHGLSKMYIFISDPYTSLMTTVLKQKNAGHITSERSSKVHVRRT